jgi:hypothetical protein
MSRRNFDGLKPPNPSSFGVRDGLGRKAEVQNPNRVSAKCAIRPKQLQLDLRKKMKATYIWQIATTYRAGRYLFFVNTWPFFYGVFVRFSTRGVQSSKTPQEAFPCQKLFAKKVEKKTIPVVFPLRFFGIAVLAVSLHEELKHTIQIFSKITPEKLKNNPKKAG